MLDIRICFFGDSFVNGTGDPACLGWSGRICAAMASSKYALTYYNLGIRGDTSEQIEARWQSEATLRLPSHFDTRLVFSFGVNDNCLDSGHLRVSPEASLSSARRLLLKAQSFQRKASQHPILFVGPPPVADEALNQRTAITSTAYATLCADLKIPYLETYQPLRQNATWMHEVALVDHSHPAAAGYQVFADLVLQWSAWQAWFS
jgi:acyl-CoA thioesterase I